MSVYDESLWLSADDAGQPTANQPRHATALAMFEAIVRRKPRAAETNAGA